MKTHQNKSLINYLYKSHITKIANQTNENYVRLFEQFNDLVSNIENKNLKNSILYSYVKIEKLFFDNITSTSKTFYEAGFNDFKKLLFTEQKLKNKGENHE